MLHLDYKPWMKEDPKKCSLCKLKALETTNHFIAICPILLEFRRLYLNKSNLNDLELIKLLNGENWFNRFKCLTSALKYRSELTSYYNH